MDCAPFKVEIDHWWLSPWLKWSRRKEGRGAGVTPGVVSWSIIQIRFVCPFHFYGLHSDPFFGIYFLRYLYKFAFRVPSSAGVPMLPCPPLNMFCQSVKGLPSIWWVLCLDPCPSGVFIFSGFPCRNKVAANCPRWLPVPCKPCGMSR